MAAAVVATGAHSAPPSTRRDRAILADEQGTSAMATPSSICGRRIWRRGRAFAASDRRHHDEQSGARRAPWRGKGSAGALPGRRPLRREALRRDGLRLGGEQSGHILDLKLAETGDGLLTPSTWRRSWRGRAPACRSSSPASRRFPQILTNVRVPRRVDFADLPRVTARPRRQERLARRPLVLRYSGTEPLARIMLEGPDQATLEAMARDRRRDPGGIGGGRLDTTHRIRAKCLIMAIHSTAVFFPHGLSHVLYGHSPAGNRYEPGRST